MAVYFTTLVSTCYKILTQYSFSSSNASFYTDVPTSVGIQILDLFAFLYLPAYSLDLKKNHCSQRSFSTASTSVAI